MDLWVIFDKPLEPKHRKMEAQYLGKQQATSGKKMMICLKSSIYDEMPEKQHLSARRKHIRIYICGTKL